MVAPEDLTSNPKEIKLIKSSVSLMVGETSTIQARVVLTDSNKKQLSDAHAKEFRFASSNKEIATVDTRSGLWQMKVK